MTISAEDLDTALCIFIERSLKENKRLGKLIKISELGFESHEEDKYIVTSEMAKRFGLL